MVFQCTDAAVEVGKTLSDHIRQILLVEVIRRVDSLVVDADDFGRYADSGAVGWQVAQNDASGTDTGIVADIDWAKHLGAGTDQDVIAEGRVTLAGVLAGTAEGHTVIDGAVVADLRRLAEDDAHAVVDEQAFADLRARMDLDAGAMASVLTDPARKEKVLVLKQPVRDAVIDQDVKTGVQQNDFQHTARGRVFALNIPCVLQQTHEGSLPFPRCRRPEPGGILLSCPIIITQVNFNVQRHARNCEDFFKKSGRIWSKVRFFGRVAKNQGFGRETFLQTKSAGSIDTFCVSMIKYIEINRE